MEEQGLVIIANRDAQYLRILDEDKSFKTQ